MTINNIKWYLNDINSIYKIIENINKINIKYN